MKIHAENASGYDVHGWQQVRLVLRRNLSAMVVREKKCEGMNGAGEQLIFLTRESFKKEGRSPSTDLELKPVIDRRSAVSSPPHPSRVVGVPFDSYVVF